MSNVLIIKLLRVTPESLKVCDEIFGDLPGASLVQSIKYILHNVLQLECFALTTYT